MFPNLEALCTSGNPFVRPPGNSLGEHTKASIPVSPLLRSVSVHRICGAAELLNCSRIRAVVLLSFRPSI